MEELVRRENQWAWGGRMRTEENVVVSSGEAGWGPGSEAWSPVPQGQRVEVCAHSFVRGLTK